MVGLGDADAVPGAGVGRFFMEGSSAYLLSQARSSTSAERQRSRIFMELPVDSDAAGAVRWPICLRAFFRADCGKIVHGNSQNVHKPVARSVRDPFDGMVALKDKFKTALDENRMLVLVVQVLVGFQFRGVFEAGFERLPQFVQWLKLLAFVFLLVTLALLLTPSAYHRIAESGECTKRCHDVLTRILELALLPFAAGLGLDVFVPGFRLFGTPGGVLAGAVTLICALFFWYGIEALHDAKRRKERSCEIMKPADEKHEPTPLKNKIEQVLTEGRMVLPGTQALLGFQLAGFLTDAFEKLPRASQLLHFAALGCVALSAILLMTPPAFHRLVEKGEATEFFLSLAGRFVLAGMIPLGIGTSLDFFIVAERATRSAQLSAWLAAAVLALFFGLWFAFPLWSARRRRQPHLIAPRPSRAAHTA